MGAAMLCRRFISRRVEVAGSRRLVSVAGGPKKPAVLISVRKASIDNSLLGIYTTLPLNFNLANIDSRFSNVTSECCHKHVCNANNSTIPDREKMAIHCIEPPDLKRLAI